MQAIKIDNLFRCVVIEQGEEFKQYSNVLFHQEYYSPVDEEYDYYLGFTNETDLLSRVLPGIKERNDIHIKTMRFPSKLSSLMSWRTALKHSCKGVFFLILAKAKLVHLSKIIRSC